MPQRFIYNKLIRNNMPKITESCGNKSVFDIIEDDKLFEQLLGKKMIEETNEYLASDGDKEELADMLEVFYAFLESKNYNIQEIEEIRLEKQSKRGSFSEHKFQKYIDVLNPDSLELYKKSTYTAIEEVN